MNLVKLKVMAANYKLYQEEYEKLLEIYTSFGLEFRHKETGVYYDKVPFVARQKQHIVTTKFSIMSVLYDPLKIQNKQIIGFREHISEKNYQTVFMNNIYEESLSQSQAKLLFKNQQMVCTHCSNRHSQKFMFITYDSVTKDFGTLSIPCFEDTFNTSYRQYRKLIAYTLHFTNSTYEYFQGLKTGKVLHYIPYVEFLDKVTYFLEQDLPLTEEQIKNIEYSDNVSINSYFKEFKEYITTEPNINEKLKNILINYTEDSWFPYTLKQTIGKEFATFYSKKVSNTFYELQTLEIGKYYDFENIVIKEIKHISNKGLIVYELLEGNRLLAYMTKKELDSNLKEGDVINFKAKVYKFNEFRGKKSINISNLTKLVKQN